VVKRIFVFAARVDDRIEPAQLTKGDTHALDGFNSR
jgi:hypothetical protein